VDALSASGGTAVLANQATFLVYQRFLTAVRALLAFGLCTVDDIFLQGAFYTVLPGVDAFAIQLQGVNQLDYAINRHSPAKHA
jgi:hypothetical protein